MTDDLALVGLGEDEDEDTYQMMMQSSSTASFIEEEELNTTSDDKDPDEDERGEPPIHPFSALEKSAAALPEPKPAKQSSKSKKKKEKKDQPKALAEYGTFHVLKRTGNKRTWGWIESFEETVPPSRSLLRDRFGPGSYRIEDTMGGSDEFVISPTPASHIAGSKPARRNQDDGDRHRLVMTTLLSLEERIDQVGDKVSDIDPSPIADVVVRRLSRMLLPTLRPLIEAFEKERVELGATISRIEGDVAALKTESERQNDDQLTAIIKALDDLQTRVSNPPPAAAAAPADPYDRILDDLTKASAFVQRLTGAGVAGAHDVSRSAPPPQAGELEQPAWVHVVVNALQAFSGMLRASTPPFQGAPLQSAPPPPGAGMYEQQVVAVPPNAVPPNGQAAAPVPPNGQAVPPNGQRVAPPQAAASATAGPPPSMAPAIAKMTPEIEAEAKKLGEALGLNWPELVSIAQQHGWDAETLLHATRLWTENAVTLDGMTAEIEAELRQIAQRMSIPYEYGIGLAKEHGLDAPALLELARRQLSATAGASGGRGDAS